MKTPFKVKSKDIEAYYERLQIYHKEGVNDEGTVRTAFQNLLEACTKSQSLTLFTEYQQKKQNGYIRYDAVIKDSYTHSNIFGYWEAKDIKDDLEQAVQDKKNKGYSLKNTIFQTPEHAILYQEDKEVFNNPIDTNHKENLKKLLTIFLHYTEPNIQEWHAIANEFAKRIPHIGKAITHKLKDIHKTESAFQKAFTSFHQTYIASINKDTSEDDVLDMLTQHILTERFFRGVLGMDNFQKNNLIAREIEAVIQSLTSSGFAKDSYLQELEPLYSKIEQQALQIQNFDHKQELLHTVYERFFQKFSVKQADIYGIKYTPKPIVNFMITITQELLQTHFSKNLQDKGVHILEPFAGTGNFLLSILDTIPIKDIQHKYTTELHANEIMLMPYYITSLNMEYKYYTRTKEYEPFKGICFVDTFSLSEQFTKQQEISGLTPENTERIKNQQARNITVVISNPPYNAQQKNQNNNNQNTKHPILDQEIRDTYSNDSKVTNKNSLFDPYVKAIKWATHRIKNEGIVAFITNNSFLDGIAFDGMREHLHKDFNHIYLINLGGNSRKHKKSKTYNNLGGNTRKEDKHNIFGIQVGVCISFLVKIPNSTQHTIHYHELDDSKPKTTTFQILNSIKTLSEIPWQTLTPDRKHYWFPSPQEDQYASFISIGNKHSKSAESETVASFTQTPALFKSFCNGVKTNRDAWLYNFNTTVLRPNIQKLIENYNTERLKYHDIPLSQRPKNPQDALNNDPTHIKWSSTLLNHLIANKRAEQFDDKKLTKSLYRPFTVKHLYFDPLLVDRRGLNHLYFPPALRRHYPFPKPPWASTDPTTPPASPNIVIAVSARGHSSGFAALASKYMTDLKLIGNPNGGCQTFPYYVYDEDGTTRHENVTDWALTRFQEHYKNPTITKWQLFTYTYAILHSPEYKSLYAEDLTRELPRIPFTKDFEAFQETGEALMRLHVNFESAEEYPLTITENPKPQARKDLYTISKMKLSKDKTTLIYNDYLKLEGIPPEAHNYRIENKSALERFIDGYKKREGKNSGLLDDPNTGDDSLVRAFKKLIWLSLETNKITQRLPNLDHHKITHLPNRISQT